MNAFLAQFGSTQPFLLCVGESRNSIQKFYVIVDQKAIPCMMKTAVAAFDELFKAHFVFAASYDEALYNFYTFIQTTVYGIDVGTAKESPRVKEIRVRIQNTELWMYFSILCKCLPAMFTPEVVFISTSEVSWVVLRVFLAVLWMNVLYTYLRNTENVLSQCFCLWRDVFQED